MAKKLWQGGSAEPDKKIERYTVGDDYTVDMVLLPYDVRATRAHGAMLHKAGLLSEDEWQALQAGLSYILSLYDEGRFVIRPDQEDGHTAIEQFLTENYGEVGKKIHTGRSRNDQSLTMLRLYMRDKLEIVGALISTLADRFTEAAQRLRELPMPGYTHMQRAMPTTVGIWLGAFAAALEDHATALPSLKTLLNQNPLGSASGFGIANFNADRSYTAELLGFDRVQLNPIYCANSRGMFENIVLHTLAPVMLTCGRFANDMLLFTSAEYGFFSLPHRFTTGSSIMPQKRNYDLFEVMRGNVRRFVHHQRAIEDIVVSLYSGYQRDLQWTKKPLIDALTLLEDTLDVLIYTLPELRANPEKLRAAMSEELYLTEQVYELVKKGLNFRDAYRRVKQNYFSEK